MTAPLGMFDALVQRLIPLWQRLTFDHTLIPRIRNIFPRSTFYPEDPMSHFSVNVLIPAATLAAHHHNVEAALAQILAPYQENNMGDCPAQYMEFEDTEAEYLKEYDEESVEMVQLASGERVHTHDRQFVVQGKHGPVYPADSTRVDVPYKEQYPTFEAFVTDWHGRTARDPEKGRFGYWHNPNSRWDWWVIGGRWRGFFQVKPGTPVRYGGGKHDRTDREGREAKGPVADVVRPGDLDLDAIAARHQERFDTFWAAWESAKAGKAFPPFEGPRETAFRLGLMRCENDPEAVIDPARETFVWWKDLHPNVDWSDSHWCQRRGWRDVFALTSREEFRAKHWDHFAPARTFAAIDATGAWHEPGRMGMFASVADETADTAAQYAAWYQAFLKSAGPEDLFVCIDCHV